MTAIEHRISPASLTLHGVEPADGYVAFVKATCPTCQLVAPVLRRLRDAGAPLTVYSQDDPAFPEGADPLDDTDLRRSHEMGVEVVPTLIRVERGVTTGRLEGWLRTDWEGLTGVTGLGQGMPDYRAGCGSRTLDPGMPEQLAALHGDEKRRARRLEVAHLEDEFEAMYERGWTDGLPVVPPTPERVLRMLEGTSREPQEIVAVVPPDLVECTVEKVGTPSWRAAGPSTCLWC